MASFYDSASIITIPSGYKVGTLYSAKPTDGTGDMTFTRTGDTATRVNSAGIIESCITNFAKQSNGFDTANWTKNNSTITTGITDPNGGTTAFSLAGSSASSNTKNISQVVFTTVSDVKIFSIYAKANTNSFIQLKSTTASLFVNFDLTTGTFTNGSAAFGTMESLGNGWYRCIMRMSAGTHATIQVQLVDSLSAVFNEASTTTNSVYIWRAQGQLGDFATNYIDTTTAAVTEGPVTNLPRLDYFGSTCPQLLMEPTRTNLILFSQMFGSTSWSKQSSTTSSDNVLVSPDGYTNADLITGGASSASTRVQQNFTAVSGTTYAFSAFVKQGPDNAPVAIRILSAANAILGGINIVFTGGVPAITATGLALNAKAESYGNGWYRISGTYVAPINDTNRFAYYSDTAGTNKSSYLWGAQLEAGAYATSYIPTTAATVTRNNDNMQKTSITSLIGQTEGTLFLHFKYTGTEDGYFSISDGTSANRVNLGLQLSTKRIRTLIFKDSVNESEILSASNSLIVGNYYKVAIGYKENDIAVYLNGTLIGTDNTALIPACPNIYYSAYGSQVRLVEPVLQTLVFKTRLSNADLATLTTL
jgi:hypothetical protein